MNKKQKDAVLDNLKETITSDGITETISWPAGSVSYNLGMKATWTKAQQIEIDEIKSDIKVLKQDVSELKQDVAYLKVAVNTIMDRLDLITNHLGIK